MPPIPSLPDLGEALSILNITVPVPRISVPGSDDKDTKGFVSLSSLPGTDMRGTGTVMLRIDNASPRSGRDTHTASLQREKRKLSTNTNSQI
jgi:hypothetical protein